VPVRKVSEIASYEAGIRGYRSVPLVNISPEKSDYLLACSCAGHTGESWIR
jgi:hypothetical protein